MTHTKGEWIKGHNVSQEPIVRPLSFDNGENGGFVIAQTFGRDKHANARLIAAAPDLLAACKMALNEGDDHKAIEAIKAAIAKAEGVKP
jgi:hypothetical protein